MASGIAFDEASWAKVVRRYERAAEKTRIVQTGLVAWAMDEGIREARRQIDALVYSVPAPPRSNRTGATRRAISKRKGISWRPGEGASGEIHVDQYEANRDGFYYPIVLDRGRTDIRYAPRPFWTTTVAVMRLRYRMRGQEALRALHQALRID